MVVLVVFLQCVRFLLNLPSKTRIQFVIVGKLYVGRALSLEMTAGQYATWYGEDNIVIFLMIAVEETLEIIGVVTFILCAFLLYGLAPTESPRSERQQGVGTRPSAVMEGPDA